MRILTLRRAPPRPAARLPRSGHSCARPGSAKFRRRRLFLSLQECKRHSCKRHSFPCQSQSAHVLQASQAEKQGAQQGLFAESRSHRVPWPPLQHHPSACWMRTTTFPQIFLKRPSSEGAKKSHTVHKCTEFRVTPEVWVALWGKTCLQATGFARAALTQPNSVSAREQQRDIGRRDLNHLLFLLNLNSQYHISALLVWREDLLVPALRCLSLSRGRSRGGSGALSCFGGVGWSRAGKESSEGWDDALASAG